jgi:general secretion pathway protein K
MTGSRDGYILVAVLGVMLVLAGLVASASLAAQSALRSARADEGAAALDGVLRGGLELAAFRIFALKQPFGAVNGERLRVPGGTAVPVFSDGADRIDINAADPAVLVGAFRAAGLDEGTAGALKDRLVAMRGVGAQANTPLAPPDAVAQGGAPVPSSPAGTQGPHTDFPSVADFVAFAGLDREVAADLAPLLTVDNPDGRVDVLTASRRVLLALPDMSEAKVETILSARETGASAAGDLRTALGDQARYVKFEAGPCFRIDIEARDALGRTARQHGVVAASRTPNEPFYVLDWERAP